MGRPAASPGLISWHRCATKTEINTNWYTGPDNFRLVLRDVYLDRKSLFGLRNDALTKRFVLANVLLHPLVDAAPLPAATQSEADFRNRYPAQYRADDGHQVRSKSELLICNWLHHHGIAHAYERVVPVPERLVCDFHIQQPGRGECYVEHWGLDTDAYRQRRAEKVRIDRTHRLNLLELEESDIGHLDDVLPKHLRAFGLSVS